MAAEQQDWESDFPFLRLVKLRGDSTPSGVSLCDSHGEGKRDPWDKENGGKEEEE